MKIRSYADLMSCLTSILECAHNQGRMDSPIDVMTMEFVVSWFEANSEDVREFLEGDN